jgi:hypothetical protein
VAPQLKAEIVIAKPHKSCIFQLFCNNIQDTKDSKMADPILESSLKTVFNTIECHIFFAAV